MTAERIVNIFGAIVTVALASVIVSSGNTSKIIAATGNAFATAVKSATGRK